MTPALKTILEIYASMEQGNLGKLLIVLDDTIHVHTAQCMGGNRRGREGILQLVPAFYRMGTGIKKTVDQFVEQESLVIVTGNIQITIPGVIIDTMPFADVWSFDNNKLSAVIFYYSDPQAMRDYLKQDHYG